MVSFLHWLLIIDHQCLNCHMLSFDGAVMFIGSQSHLFLRIFSSSLFVEIQIWPDKIWHEWHELDCRAFATQPYMDEWVVIVLVFFLPGWQSAREGAVLCKRFHDHTANLNTYGLVWSASCLLEHPQNKLSVSIERNHSKITHCMIFNANIELTSEVSWNNPQFKIAKQ